MHRFLLLLCSYIITFTAFAQTDSSRYSIMLNDGSSFDARILDIKKGEYIKLLKDDNSEMTLQWDGFRDYKKLPDPSVKSRKQLAAENKAAKAQALEDARMEAVKAVYRRWSDCFIVFRTGDTVWGKIGPPHWLSSVDTIVDYSEASLPNFRHRIDFVGKRSGREVRLDARDIKELYIPDEHDEFKKYLTNLDDSVDFHFYRVLIDGPSKLLFTQTSATLLPTYEPFSFVGTKLAPPKPTMSSIASEYLTLSGQNDIPVYNFYIYYKGVITKVRSEGFFDTSPAFRKKSEEIFNECPALLEKIENKTYESVDLRQIVNEFNACLKSKGR